MDAESDVDDRGTGDITTPQPSFGDHIVKDGDTVLLVFADQRQIFALCSKKRWTKGHAAPLRINKNGYSTHMIVGLSYGSVLEVQGRQLVPLPPTEDLLPKFEHVKQDDTPEVRDNRHLVDNNTAQQLGYEELTELRRSGVEGSAIVRRIVDHSTSFHTKTDFSQAKYIAKKQMKYQQRCRVVRCTGATICEAMYLKDAKRIFNLREDTLGQILSYANICAGSQVLVYETCQGIVTGAVAERLGGYGKVLSVYTGVQPSYLEMVGKFNLSFTENQCIKWLHAGDLFNELDGDADHSDDPERLEREAMEWPCPLQDHTRQYLETELTEENHRRAFMYKRSSRFTRKITRHSPKEAREWLYARKSDSVVLASGRSNPTPTLIKMLPFLSPSCPFVVFSEFIEPLVECFAELQRMKAAINLRLSGTWSREYQILAGRTHPSMNMSQSGGYILSGIKLDEKWGHTEIDEDLLRELHLKVRNRRKQKPSKKRKEPSDDNDGSSGIVAPKRPQLS